MPLDPTVIEKFGLPIFIIIFTLWVMGKYVVPAIFASIERSSKKTDDYIAFLIEEIQKQRENAKEDRALDRAQNEQFRKTLESLQHTLEKINSELGRMNEKIEVLDEDLSNLYHLTSAKRSAQKGA